MTRTLLCTLVLHAVGVLPGHTQRIPVPLILTPAASAHTPFIARQTDQPAASRGSVGRAIGFGLLFGAAGFVGGALLGDAASDECDNAIGRRDAAGRGPHRDPGRAAGDHGIR